MFEENAPMPPNDDSPSDSPPEWDTKFRSFLKKAQDDFKRAATDVKKEAERLMKEVQDPKNQAKMKHGVQEASVWAKKTAEQLASLVEVGVKQAEGTLNEVKKQFTKPIDDAPSAPPSDAVPPPAPTPKNAAPPEMDEQEEAAPEPAKSPKKTMGRGTSPKKSAPASKPAKKSIGKKKKNADPE